MVTCRFFYEQIQFLTLFWLPLRRVIRLKIHGRLNLESLWAIFPFDKQLTQGLIMHKPLNFDSPILARLQFKPNKLDQRHPHLLRDCGLISETIDYFDIGYCTEKKTNMAEHIVIPIKDVKGEMVSYVGYKFGQPQNKLKPKYIFSSGFNREAHLFNLNRAVRQVTARPLIIVQDFFDVLTLYQFGYRYVVAIMGNTMSQKQEELLRCSLSPHEKILIMFNEDGSGREERKDVANRLSKFFFVKIHAFTKRNMQPKHLAIQEVPYLFP